MTRRSALFLAVVAVVTTACGGSSPEPQLGVQPGVTPPAGQTIVVVTSPTETDLQPGDSIRFAAQVTGTANTSVKWSVDEADGGSVDSSGVYTAPASEGTYHVRAESVVASSSATAASVKGGGSSVVHVKRTATAQPVTVAVDPATVTVPAGGSATFAAAVAGTTARSVNWTVAEGSNCGSVSAAGVYTAPPSGATCTVVATSQADSSKSAAAIVTVTPPIAVAVSPAAPSIVAGGSITFTATVSGTTSGQSSAVTWSVPSGAGTIDAATGVYVAPAIAGTYVVTARSVADTSKTATASVTVTAAPPPPVAIAISPTSATLDACKSQVFTATVTNSSNTAVTWSVVEAGAGSVTNGTYVAPSTAGTYHVMAVSQADPTKSIQATITVGAERVLSVAVTPGSGSLQANGTLAFSAMVTTTCGTFAAQ